MKKKLIIKTSLITAAFVFVASTLVYMTPGGMLFLAEISDRITDKSHARFLKIERLIEKSYMGTYNEHALVDNGLHGYVRSLHDPYSDYLNYTEFTEFSSNIGGAYKGIGVTVENADGKITVGSVTLNSPAHKAGITKGDIILKVNGKAYSGDELSFAVDAIKKTNEKEKVVLTIERGGAVSDVDIVIEEIKIDYVSSKMLEDNIGYIRLTTFGKNADKDFEKSIKNLKEKGMKGLIIDLRSNPGGTLESAVGIADLLLPEGPVITVRNKSGKEEVYKSDKNEINLPMCVLINETSASASEVIAGAMRDFKKAVLIGKKTYGKGVVQSVYDLGDGSALRLTTAKYYTPSGECIQGTGINADIEVDLPEGVVFTQQDIEIQNDTQLEAAKREIKSKIS